MYRVHDQVSKLLLGKKTGRGENLKLRFHPWYTVMEILVADCFFFSYRSRGDKNPSNMYEFDEVKKWSYSSEPYVDTKQIECILLVYSMVMNDNVVE